MLYVIEGKQVPADIILEACEKPIPLLDTFPDIPIDHPVNHHGVVEVDPEGQFFPSFFELV